MRKLFQLNKYKNIYIHIPEIFLSLTTNFTVSRINPRDEGPIERANRAIAIAIDGETLGRKRIVRERTNHFTRNEKTN